MNPVGHYAVGIRDGGSEWHVWSGDRRDCPSCPRPAEPARTAGDPLAPEPKWSVLVERVAALEAALGTLIAAVANPMTPSLMPAVLAKARAALSEASEEEK